MYVLLSLRQGNRNLLRLSSRRPHYGTTIGKERQYSKHCSKSGYSIHWIYVCKIPDDTGLDISVDILFPKNIEHISQNK